VVSHYWNFVATCWIAFAFVWGVAGLRIRAPKRRASIGFTLLNTALLYAGFILVFLGRVNGTPLGVRFTPDASIVGFAGVLLILSGFAIAMWARWVLGANWSATARIGEGQYMVCRGPYAQVAHPIYSGIALATLGTAIVGGSIGNLLGFGLVVLSFWQKGRREERLMVAEFGNAYSAYRRRVKFMIPFVL
jgi:protein-S-isoprenylcysteine O-methyltransferase